jgi:hypothetical protein
MTPAAIRVAINATREFVRLAMVALDEAKYTEYGSNQDAAKTQANKLIRALAVMKKS